MTAGGAKKADWKERALISDKKKETYVYGSLKERFTVEWKIFTLAFVFILIADNIGQMKIPVGEGMFILFPIFYAITLGVLNGPQALEIVNNKQVKTTSELVVVGTCPFIVRLGIMVEANIDTIFQSGPVLLLHGFGNLLGPLLAPPITILPGMKREVIGACHSISGEHHMTLINNIYGPDSAEARGDLFIYIVGGVVGTIYFGLMTSVVGMTGQFHPQALGLASDVGAGIIMASSSAGLCAIYPSWAETVSAVVGMGETIARITGMYITMLVATPMTDKPYRILEPKLGGFALKSKEIKEETV